MAAPALGPAPSQGPLGKRVDKQPVLSLRVVSHNLPRSTRLIQLRAFVLFRFPFYRN